MNSTVRRCAGLMLAAFVLVGCSESPLEAYHDAVDRLADVSDTVSEQKAEVERLRKRLDTVRERLQEAMAALEEDRAALAAARQSAAEHASDQVLFHVIQNQLLHDDNFQNAVITVGVDSGQVTLTGVVPDKRTRDAARQLAAGQPGVTAVVSKLTVRGLEAAGKAHRSFD